MIEPFLSALPVLQKLADSGYEAYFVGGSVRDFLLGKPISDVDIATSATPDEVKKVFSKTVDIGIEHGTILVLYRNSSYEITTFRTESEYQDYRRPKEVSFIRNLKDDLKRRDFTMNAIAMDQSGNLIDPFEGQKAIQEKIIKTVGQAEERFQEDALRMMRAVRFISQLSFSIESQTLLALENLAPLLGKIAVERKRAELEKLLIGPNCKEAINILLNTGLYRYLPGLDNQKEQLKKLFRLNWNSLTKNEMWALVLYCINLKGKEIELFLRNWKLALKDIREIQQVIFFLESRLKKDWEPYDLYLAKRDIIVSVEKLFQVINGTSEARIIDDLVKSYDRLPIKERGDLGVTGNDLLAWFNQEAGPWLKDSLLSIERAIVEGKVLNEKNKIKEWLMECNQK
ncbi:CCA tRNA nucleotidyltransferase [Neobacillus niacini]|uniref:CCA tRNA nucleotidyltransferase n=1 Tax=Neobacillus niacini TaxID=86668 RepID=UPI002856F0A5|nr:CCA tRNA nucleotidyltransferase [Neobacillus niacini]MDR6998525.1 tRNA nucleotidyltransferase (CCA-adding enzyme) [Neobacillus niacini]